MSVEHLPPTGLFDFLIHSSMDERDEIRLFAVNEWAKLCQEHARHRMDWSVVLELLQTLSLDFNTRVRYAATRALGLLILPFRGQPEEIKKIRLSLKKLASEGNEQIRGRVVRSLDFLCRQMERDCRELRAAIRLIQYRIRDRCGMVRREAVEALLHCLQHPALSSNMENSIMDSLGCLSLDSDPVVRGAALRAFREAKEISKVRLGER